MVGIVAVVALITVAVGGVALVNEWRGSDGSTAGIQLPTVETADSPATAITPNGTGGGSPIPTFTPAPQFDLPAVDVDKPEYVNITNNITRVREHYSETYTHGKFTVGWRPGAFPPERAAEVAARAEVLIAEANAKMQTNFYPDLEIFLADQLYTEECHGCQGFAAADLFQIFLLEDGSVAPDEFDALLIHEITHVLAAHTISLPHSLFFAEGLATWVMSDHLVQSGYISPLQTAAWAYKAGAMPSLQSLREDDFAGRVRARAQYDGAASFTFFAIETYGWENYCRLYALDPPEDVMGKTWDELEVEWHAYLDNWADNVVNGVDAVAWSAAVSQVDAGYVALYTDPAPVTKEQYTALVQARLTVNRGEVGAAMAAIDASGLVPRTAQ